MHGQLIVELGAGATVAAFDPVSGERRWATGEDSVSYQTPIPWRLGERDQLVAAGDKQLLGLDPSDGGHPGRTADNQLTVADLTGVAVQDIQISKAVWQKLMNSDS